MSTRQPSSGDGRSRLQSVLLGAYARLADARVLDNAASRRTFEAAYGAYKLVLEAGPIHQLRRHVTPGSVVVDVGANIGFFTLRFARWVGPAGQVVAIEPDAGHIERLRARLGRRGLGERVTTTHAAATNVAGRTHLVLNRHHPGDHKIGEEGVEVDAVTVDALLAPEAPRRVSLIKIDVQGAEELVIEGALRTIEKHRPALFVEVFEDTLREFGSSVDQLVGRLMRFGYRGHVLGRRGISGALDTETLVAMHTGRYGDVLFLPSESRPPLR